ncbi:MAG: cupin domain-containing protein [Bacteroidota bacterium]|nr:cupin domain-containing protein [Bacteroidota bacterium]
MKKININEKFLQFDEYWNPKIVGELNHQHVKIAKLKGEFIWHQHINEDEMFWVIKGQLLIELRNEIITLNENEMIIIPRGVEHKPVAKEEVWVMLFEPTTTLNTGNHNNHLTQNNLENI